MSADHSSSSVSSAPIFASPPSAPSASSGAPPPSPFVPATVGVPGFAPVRPGPRRLRDRLRSGPWGFVGLAGSGAARRRWVGLVVALVALVLAVPLLGQSAEAPEPPASAQGRAAESAVDGQGRASGGDGSASSGPVADGGIGDIEGEDAESPATARRLVRAPVRLADADVVRLLSPGDRVDVLASQAEGKAGARARVVAHRARVDRLPAPGRERAGQAAIPEAGALVVLAVPPRTATALAGAGTHAQLTVSLW